MSEPLHVAIDLGAGSGRIIVGGFGEDALELEEVHRFPNPMIQKDGALRWGWSALCVEVAAGLAAAGRYAQERGRHVATVGADTWGVDYGLVDAAGKLLEDPICYRDDRTAGVMEQVLARIPRQEVYRRTGIQFLPFNTIYQLVAHVESGLPEGAAQMLMMPDLVHQNLCGRATGEVTNASTTQLLSAEDREWDLDLAGTLQIPASLLPPLGTAGDVLGPLVHSHRSLPGCEQAQVVLPGTHDTASAVAGTPLRPGWAYISSGTWSLVGVETQAPELGEAACELGFTNEAGVHGTNRLLTNVMGLWVLECCRREWAEAGEAVMSYADIDEALASTTAAPELFDPDAPELLNPPSMLSAIPSSQGQLSTTHGILASLARRYAEVIDALEQVTGREIPGIHVIGGGSRNHTLCQMTADATARPVVAGPIEATAIGNLLVQAIALKRFTNLANARSWLADRLALATYEPRP